MYNFAAVGVHHRLGPHQECKASWSVRLVPRKWHTKDALPPVTVVSANEIYYDPFPDWMVASCSSNCPILYLTWGVGGLKMFQGRSYLLPTLVLQPGNQCFTKLPDACLPVTFTKQKIRVLFCHSPYEIIRSHLFLFAKSSCCLRKSACLPPKGLYFHVLISMFLNCKGDGSPHEVMVDHTHFCG